MKMKTRKCKRRRNRGGGKNRGKTKKNAVGRGKLSLLSFVTCSTERNNNYRKMIMYSDRI